MKNFVKLLGIAVFAVIVGVGLFGCGETEEDLPISPDLTALTGTVNIIGTAQVGQTLIANTGNLGGSGTIFYQWDRVTTDFWGNTYTYYHGIETDSSTYTVQTADLGFAITVNVSRSGNYGIISSSPTATVVRELRPTEGLAYTPIKGNSEFSVSLGTARALGEIVIPAAHDGLAVTAIADNAFSAAENLTSIVIPNSVTHIGSSAFSGCSSLMNVTIPDRVTNIGENAFWGCTSLTRVTFMGTITDSGFSDNRPFPGDLRTRYFASDGGIGTYSRSSGSEATWVGAPTGVSASDQRSDSITLTWNSVSNATGYKVYRGSSADGFFTELRNWRGTIFTDNELTDYGLTENTTYFYRVVIMYNDETSPRSTAVSIATLPRVPGIPTGLTVRETSGNHITISWNPVTGATGYGIYGSSSIDGSYIIVGATSTATSYINTGLTGSTTYYYKVSAVNSGGEGERSNAVSATTLPVITINTNPVELTIMIAGEINGSLNVSASVTGNESLSYQWYSNTTNSTSGGDAISGATNVSFNIPTILATGTYYYFVEVMATGGAVSMRSNVATVRVIQPTLPVEMVWVPGGSFELGREIGTAGSGDTTPVSTVTLTGFHIGKYPVTQAQYQAVMGTNPSWFSSDPAAGEVQERRPVDSISRYDAIVFCNRLSMMEGLTPAYSINGSTNPDDWGNVPIGWSNNATWNAATVVSGSSGYRLPTEAQWEYAAKGGNNPPIGFTFAGSNNANDVAWHSGNSGNRTREVGLLLPNGLGIYDMSGNMTELCWDWLSDYTSEAKNDPMGPTTFGNNVSVFRGGSSETQEGTTRSTYRGDSSLGFMIYIGGFRLVRP